MTESMPVPRIAMIAARCAVASRRSHRAVGRRRDTALTTPATSAGCRTLAHGRRPHRAAGFGLVTQ